VIAGARLQRPGAIVDGLGGMVGLKRNPREPGQSLREPVPALGQALVTHPRRLPLHLGEELRRLVENLVRLLAVAPARVARPGQPSAASPSSSARPDTLCTSSPRGGSDGGVE